MKFIIIANNYMLRETFQDNEFISTIYDLSDPYLGKIYYQESAFYIEFILERMTNFLAHVVFNFFECKDKDEIITQIPLIAKFIHFIKDTLNKVKHDYIEKYDSNNSEVITAISINDKDKWVKYLIDNSNLPFINADDFLTQYLSYSCVKTI